MRLHIHYWSLKGMSEVCSQSGSPFLLGEEVMTAILKKEDRFIRKDFSLTSWKTLKKAPFSYWKTTYSPRKTSKSSDLLQFFNHLMKEGEEDKLIYAASILLEKKGDLVFVEKKGETIIYKKKNSENIFLVPSVKLNLREVGVIESTLERKFERFTKEK